MTADRAPLVEKIAQILWRIDNPTDEEFSQVAPNDWERWPRHGRAASLAQVRFCQNDYRDQAGLVAKVILDAIAEPSEGMIDAAQWGTMAGAGQDVETIYRTMIAALRKEIADV